MKKLKTQGKTKQTQGKIQKKLKNRQLQLSWVAKKTSKNKPWLDSTTVDIADTIIAENLDLKDTTRIIVSKGMASKGQNSKWYWISDRGP